MFDYATAKEPTVAKCRLRMQRIVMDGKTAILVSQTEGDQTQEAIQKMFAPLASVLEIKPEQILVLPAGVDLDTYNMPCCG